MLINTDQELVQLVKQMIESPVIVLDTETTGLNPYLGDRLIGISILIPSTEATYYLPFRHNIGPNLPIHCLKKLAPCFADPSKVMIGFNIKFDVHILEADGLPVFNRTVDVMLGSHLNNENELSFALKRLGTKYIDSEAGAQERQLLSDLNNNKSAMLNLSPDMVAPYAEQDVILTWKLAQFMNINLTKQNLSKLWSEVNEYCAAVTHMEHTGVLIDKYRCVHNAEHAQTQIDKLYQDMVKIVGHDFNPNSVPQLREILNSKLTDKNALTKCTSPVAPILLNYRGWFKAMSTYYNGFLDTMDCNQRIHPNLNMHGTVSGRLSCTSPNLQALPKGKDQYRVRELVIAPPKHVLFSFDWSQVELRLLAHYTKEPFLQDVFKNNKDIHQETAKKLNMPRDLAKRINFGIVYGMGAEHLSESAGLDIDAAKKYLDEYHSMLPGVRKLYQSAEQIAIRNRYIPMWTGRLRHYRPEDETHKAMSNLIQGGVAEMMRMAITRLDKMLMGSQVRMNLQVHDEILFEVPEKEAVQWADPIKKVMENFKFSVPIIAAGAYGPDWSNMQDFDYDLTGYPIMRS